MSVVEMLLIVAVFSLVVGAAPYVTWRRGGSRRRVAAALLVSLIPYGFILGAVIALTTKRHAPATPLVGS